MRWQRQIILSSRPALVDSRCFAVNEAICRIVLTLQAGLNEVADTRALIDTFRTLDAIFCGTRPDALGETGQRCRVVGLEAPAVLCQRGRHDVESMEPISNIT